MRPPRAFTHISNSKLSFFKKISLFRLKMYCKTPLWAPNLHFSNEKTNIFDEKSILFQWAVLSWSWGGLVVPGAGQERSHAAWRSFFSTTMLPMQRGARSGPRGCRQEERSHAAWRSLFAKTMLLMQRGARSGQRRHKNNQTDSQCTIIENTRTLEHFNIF